MQNSVIGVETLLRVLWGRRWTVILVSALVVGVALLVTLKIPIRYSATSTLIIEFEQPVAAQIESPLAPSLQSNYLATQLGIIASRHVAAKVVDRLGLENEPAWQNAFDVATGGHGSRRDWIARVLMDSLEVNPGTNSRLVNISYSANDPRVAAEVANAFAWAYESANLEMSTRPARREAEQYQQWLQELRDKVDRAQQTLSDYQRENGILLVDERLDVETARLKELVAQRIRAEGDARSNESKLQRIRELEESGQSLQNLSAVLDSEVVRDLKRELGRKETEFAEISRQVGTNHPRYKRVNAEMATLRRKLAGEVSSIAESVSNQVEETRSRMRAFQEAEAVQKSRVMELKQRRNQMPALVRELDSAQANYEQGLQRYNQFRSRGRVSQTNVTLLNPALVSMQPSSPNLRRNLALGLLLGLMFGIGAAVSRELWDRRIRSEDDLRDMDDVALLGRLPAHK